MNSPKPSKKDDSEIKSAAEIALEKAGSEELEDLPEDPSENSEVKSESQETQDPEDKAFKDKYLRVRADLENIQRRMREERESMRLNTLTTFMRDLLPFLDSLDRALETAQEDDSDLAKGLLMTRTLLDQAFQANNIKPIATEEGFDPNYHEAITQIEDDSVPEGTIKTVIEKGYLIGERVIRHSKVQVTSGGAPRPELEGEEDKSEN